MPALLIEDGYTTKGTVPEVKGLTPRVEFTFRPALMEAISDYDLAARASGKQVVQALAALLEKHLVSWDVVDRQGVPVPINAAMLARVPHTVLLRMLDIVCGYKPAQQEADQGN